MAAGKDKLESRAVKFVGHHYYHGSLPARELYGGRLNAAALRLNQARSQNDPTHVFASDPPVEVHLFAIHCTRTNVFN